MRVFAMTRWLSTSRAEPFARFAGLMGVLSDFTPPHFVGRSPAPHSGAGPPAGRLEADAERDREVLRVCLEVRYPSDRRNAGRRIHFGSPHIVEARLDVELRVVPEGHTAADVDAEVVGGPIADDAVNGHERRITDQPVRIADRGVADARRRDLDLAMVVSEPADRVASDEVAVARLAAGDDV